MSREGEASGTGASRTSTKPSGSTRATFTCSLSTGFPISNFVVSQRSASLIRFSTLRRTTSIPGQLQGGDRSSRGRPAAGIGASRSVASASNDLTRLVETQVYQAILERRPAPVIPRLKEILAKPDPALGFFNGELRFWLGWAQEVAGDHAAAQETLATSTQRTGIFPQRTAGKLSAHWRSCADQYGPW